jgi:hypothetical protein
MTAIFGCTNALAALVPLPCAQAHACASTAAEVQRWSHDAISAASTIALALGALAIALSVRTRRVPWLRRASRFTFWVTSVAGTALLAVFSAQDSTSWGTGLSQRVQISLTSLWILSLALFAGGRSGAPGDRRPTDSVR